MAIKDIKELGYAGLSQTPQALAKFFIKQYMEVGKEEPFPRLQAPFNSLLVPVSLKPYGISALKKRKLFFKAAKIMQKKGFYLFFTSSDSFVVCWRKTLDWKMVKKSNKLQLTQTKQVKLIEFTKLFHGLGITSGGVTAFFAFMRKLDKLNSKGLRTLAVGAFMLSDQLVPYISFKPSHLFREDEEVVSPTIKLPEVKVRVDPVKMVAPTKTLYLTGGAQGWKHRVCKEVGKELTDIKPLLKEEGLDPYSFVNDTLGSWASDSVSNEAGELQVAVANLLKLKQKYLKNLLNSLPFSVTFKQGKLIRKDVLLPPVVTQRLALEIYQKTQRFLKKKGIKNLLLYRGMNFNKFFPGFKKTVVQKTVVLNPLSSFSSSLDEAEAFVNEDGYGAILVTNIPASRIFSCPHTGLGCLEEQEFVVMGGRIKAYLFNVENVSRVIEEDEDPFDFIRDIVKEKLFKKVKEVKADLEKEDEESLYADAGDNANWIKQGLDTGSFPMIGTPEFEEWLKSKNITFEKAMSLPAYRMARVKFKPVQTILYRMAASIHDAPVHGQKPFLKEQKSLCFKTVVDSIIARHMTSDKIWFFGDIDPKHPTVWHALLTDKANKVVANNYKGVGSSPSNFTVNKGYKIPSGEYLPIMGEMKVGEFLLKYVHQKE